MPGHEVTVTTIGKLALEALAHNHRASILGKTSRGVFLRLFSGWVIFPSFESYHGPLTLNLHGNPGVFQDLEIGSIVWVSPEALFFPDVGLSLSIAEAEPWQAAAHSRELLPTDALLAQVILISRQATLNSGASQLVALLPFVLGDDEQRNIPVLDYDQVLTRLQEAFRTNQVSAIGEALGAFVGMGVGLTPSGDDLVIGFLLAANRWGERLFPGLETRILNEDILARAARATTALSVSLIECATLGQADERLILALDGIATGNPDADACAASLASWGSSSGFDALVGMALFVRYSFLSRPFV